MAGITINSDALVSISEGGTMTTFTVVLDEQPTAPVFLILSSSDNGEVTVQPNVLTFQTTDWDQAQTVTLTGADDPVVDGNQTSTITVTVLVSNDMEYDALAPETIMVTTTDDETPGFIISQTTASVGEDGTGDTLTVRLSDQPTSDVTLNVSSSDTDEYQISLQQCIRNVGQFIWARWISSYPLFSGAIK